MLEDDRWGQVGKSYQSNMSLTCLTSQLCSYIFERLDNTVLQNSDLSTSDMRMAHACDGLYVYVQSEKNPRYTRSSLKQDRRHMQYDAMVLVVDYKWVDVVLADTSSIHVQGARQKWTHQLEQTWKHQICKERA